MKKIIALFAILGIPSLVLGLAIHSNKIRGKAKMLTRITIHFKTPPGIDSLDTYVWDAQNLLHFEKIQTGKIEHSNYSFKTAISHPVIIGFEQDTISLYSSFLAHSISHGFIVEPGDNIHLEVGEDLKMGILNIKFSGKGSAKYQCIQELISKINGRKRKPLYLFNPDEQFARADSDQLEVRQIMAKYRNQVSQTAFKIVELEYLCNTYFDPIGELLHHMNDRNTLVRYAPIILRQKARFSNRLACYDKSNFVFMRSLAILEKRIKDPGSPEVEFYQSHRQDDLEMLNRAYKDHPVIRDILLAERLTAFILKVGMTSDLEKSLTDFLSCANKNGLAYDQMVTIKSIYKRELTKGVKAFDFMLPDTNGKIVRQADFKGKVIVIDFFFNGCVGCYYTAPVLDSLEHIYTGKNVVFVAVSVDRSKASWRKGIGTYSSKNAIQVFTEGLAANHPIVKFYRVGTYPTIVMVDKQGELLSAQTPDPRLPSGWTAFTKLLDDALSRP